jgi:signal transduction histidine kinase
VKKIITFYQGEIWLESEEGVGTTFFVKLKKES